jgi:hypothetical protein
VVAVDGRGVPEVEALVVNGERIEKTR